MGKHTKETNNIINRKAYHDYEIIETLECGVVLKGHQIKSIRSGMCNLKDSWAEVSKGELFINGMHITPWETTNEFDVDTKRPIKCLAHKPEIRNLAQKIKEKGFTLVPLRLYIVKAKCKVEIGLCKGKTLYDKRETLKKKDEQRELAQTLKFLG